jgi:hypothetical protein
MTDPSSLVCPSCERTEQATERVPCPDCGSDRTYLTHHPALPDATTEAYVKFAAGAVEDATADPERREDDSEDCHRESSDDCHEDGREDADGSEQDGGQDSANRLT